jgi:hypothetical protein
MDARKYPLDQTPPTPVLQALCHNALAVIRERGWQPTHWSQDDLGLDSAPEPGLMFWDGPRYLAAIDLTGHMYWFA